MELCLLVQLITRCAPLMSGLKLVFKCRMLSTFSFNFAVPTLYITNFKKKIIKYIYLEKRIKW